MPKFKKNKDFKLDPGYTPFKMKGSPFQRNFGVGEKEEVSPTKNILGKVLSGLGEVAQAAADAGAGTTYGDDKKKEQDAKKAKEEEAAKSELEHKRNLEVIEKSKSTSKIKQDPDQNTDESTLATTTTGGE